jgi:hypothetical protein
VVAAIWGWRRFSPTGRWRSKPYVDLGVLVVDYTVPFDNYREHSGLFWLLNHEKVRAPVPPQAAGKDYAEPWQPARDYVGYRPSDRDHPLRLSHVNRRGTQLIYVTDTYGVYRGDLLHIDTRSAEMDYTPLVFGGLSSGDTYALSDFVGQGGMVVAEFNTFCEPTGLDERKRMEDLFGVDWTDWVGRVFADPYDTDDVPHWLPREFAKQYPGATLPRSPILLLAERTGRLLVLPGPSIADVAPRVVMTGAGAQRYPQAAHDAPYYFWFSIMRARAGTTVYAQLLLPNIEGVTQLLGSLGLGLAPPALTERDVGTGRAIYFAGDFADMDFEPGSYERADAISDNAERLSALTGMTTAPAFWLFYAPVVQQLLSEAASARKPMATPHR